MNAFGAIARHRWLAAAIVAVALAISALPAAP